METHTPQRVFKLGFRDDGGGEPVQAFRRDEFQVGSGFDPDFSQLVDNVGAFKEVEELHEVRIILSEGPRHQLPED